MPKDNLIIDKSILEPLFKPWEAPDSHRIKAKDRDGSTVAKGRRKSGINIVNNLRAELAEWREAFYIGASDTSRHLLNYWFEHQHRVESGDGEELDFSYYFCQREAVEALIYLKEVRQIERLAQLVENFEGENAEFAALGINPEDDLWTKYAFKLATGAGKTKCMSLAIVWSYFHALRESDSPMARHFVVIAPNLTVFERLKEDFRPEGGGVDIFDKDPLIPPEWRGDWNLTTVIQDEAGGVSTGGTLYLTNIHRLYAKTKTRRVGSDTFAWMGPKVSKQKALDTGAALRDRITSHGKIMVMNDEAHHVWDPDNAWSEAIETLHKDMTGNSSGIVAQLDFSATPKDNSGRLFRHIVCDTPLGEAVDAGIVKCPIIGQANGLTDRPSDDAAYKYEMHLQLGYKRWQKSKEEWEKSGKKALLFVMCGNTDEADQITRRLNTDTRFEDLNGKTINLHTNLKGKVKTIGSGKNKRQVFDENEKQISDDDLKALRKLSRDLDSNTSPYFCIVSVLMLREGWDVKNVTTIVPLRPYSSKANILPEQTLGRGLRRMTPPGGAVELVTVVEHPAFARLNQQELMQEGLPLEIVDIEKVPTTTVSIFPDESKNNFHELDIEIPVLSQAYTTKPTLDTIKFKDVEKYFKEIRVSQLPLGEKTDTILDYEGKNLFTGETVEIMRVDIQLLQNGFGAITYFIRELEYVCKVKGTHSILAPLLKRFIEELIFDTKTSLLDDVLVKRLSASDVREYIRATFVPLIRSRILQTETRITNAQCMRISQWRPYQATVSERHPVIIADKTIFNLVPCDRSLEEAFSQWLDYSPNIASFAKNSGPQALRLDYLSAGSRLAFYKPDFICRLKNGNILLVETKGRVDRDVPLKAKAAVEWCKSASDKSLKWEYLYVPQGEFERFKGDSIEELQRACEPALANILDEKIEDDMPLFNFAEEQNERLSDKALIVSDDILRNLPSRFKRAIDEASAYFVFASNKEDFNFAPVFTSLFGVMDEVCRGLLLKRLRPEQPANIAESKNWLNPAGYDSSQEKWLKNLKRTIVHQSGASPIGLLRNCLDYALNERNSQIDGVFESLRRVFRVENARKLLETVTAINDFRNNYRQIEWR